MHNIAKTSATFFFVFLAFSIFLVSNDAICSEIKKLKGSVVSKAISKDSDVRDYYINNVVVGRNIVAEPELLDCLDYAIDNKLSAEVVGDVVIEEDQITGDKEKVFVSKTCRIISNSKSKKIKYKSGDIEGNLINVTFGEAMYLHIDYNSHNLSYLILNAKDKIIQDMTNSTILSFSDLNDKANYNGRKTKVFWIAKKQYDGTLIREVTKVELK